MLNQATAKEIFYSSRLCGDCPPDWKHIYLASKIDNDTFLEALIYNVPDNFALVVTYAALRTVPEPNDASLTAMDWRSTDYNATGETEAAWLVQDLNGTNSIASYFSILNRPCFLAFPGGSKVTLQINPSAGARPTTQKVVIAINAYLVSAALLDCLTHYVSSVDVGCIIAPQGATRVSSRQPVDFLFEAGFSYYLTRTGGGPGTDFVETASISAANVITPLGSVAIPGVTGARIGTLSKEGDTLFFGRSSGGGAQARVTSADVSTPATPTIISTLDYALAGSPKSLRVETDTVYLVDFTNGLVIIDVTNPAAMAVLSTTDLNAGLFAIDQANPISLAINGADLYVVNTTGPCFFAVYDVTNPAAPTQTGSVLLSAGTPTNGPGYLSRVGTTAFIIFDDSIIVIDASNPAAPVVTASVPLGNSAGEFINSYVSSDRLIITRDLSQRIEVYDVASAPFPVGFENTFAQPLWPALIDGVIFTGGAGNLADSYIEVFKSSC